MRCSRKMKVVVCYSCDTVVCLEFTCGTWRDLDVAQFNLKIWSNKINGKSQFNKTSEKKKWWPARKSVCLFHFRLILRMIFQIAISFTRKSYRHTKCNWLEHHNEKKVAKRSNETAYYVAITCCERSLRR